MSYQLRQRLLELKELLQKAESVGVMLSDTDPVKGTLLDFRSQQKEGLKNALRACAAEIDRLAEKSQPWVKAQIQRLKRNLSQESVSDVLEILEELEEEESPFELDLSIIPSEIREELAADFTELERCYNSDCFRSAVILCGRILETALHRKYFELTGNDLLEKSPGIGLGSVIAKLSEHGAEIDPGLGNQVHLINQVRIWSVHKKQQPFNPTKAQTQAIILYTLDVIEKLFRKNSGNHARTEEK
ncbi:MAG: hypothetical protein QXU88_00695 [Candidatus Woesearchaeota archaeon]